MKIVLKLRTLGIFLSLLLLCSCATEDSIHRQLPADVILNKDAGRGNWLIVMLRLKSGEELPFVVDTGAGDTFLDKSLEPKLGKRLGTTIFPSWGVKREASAYAAPQLYLGNTPLMKTGRFIFTTDRLPKSHSGRPIMGVLGMDCLNHYCIQLDFEARKMRFLDPNQVNAAGPGKASPLTFRSGRPFIHHPGLLGGTNTHLLIDSGFDGDGALESGLFQEVREQRLSVAGNGIQALGSEWMFFPEGVWDGVTYTNLTIGEGGNLIGLRFLARHLVTLNFPKQTMYLKRISIGPLVDEDVESAMNFLKDLKEKGQQPGWSTSDKGEFRSYPEVNPDSVTFTIRKMGDPYIYHYKVTRAPKDNPWKLQRAWRTDHNDKTIEEYPVP